MRQVQGDRLSMGIAGQQHAGRVEGPVGIDLGDERLPVSLMGDAHPAGTDDLTRPEGAAGR